MFTLKKVGALIGLVGALGIGASASAVITGTAHDLVSGPALQTGTDGETCIFCHTPHSPAAPGLAPLWNRTTSALGYQTYDSSTIDMTIATAPQSVSLACLSCHDGVIGYDSLLNDGGYIISGGAMTGPNMVGKDLRQDHPISVTYDIVADTEFNPTDGSGKVGGLPLYGLGQDQVECASCHDPHDSTTVPGKFLRKVNTNSDLCLTCHIK